MEIGISTVNGNLIVNSVDEIIEQIKLGKVYLMYFKHEDKSYKETTAIKQPLITLIDDRISILFECNEISTSDAENVLWLLNYFYKVY